MFRQHGGVICSGNRGVLERSALLMVSDVEGLLARSLNARPRKPSRILPRLGLKASSCAGPKTCRRDTPKPERKVSNTLYRGLNN